MPANALELSGIGIHPIHGFLALLMRKADPPRRQAADVLAVPGIAVPSPEPPVALTTACPARAPSAHLHHLDLTPFAMTAPDGRSLSPAPHGSLSSLLCRKLMALRALRRTWQSPARRHCTPSNLHSTHASQVLMPLRSLCLPQHWQMDRVLVRLVNPSPR